MSRTAKIVILFIAVIAIGWGIGKYTSPSPSASQEEGASAGTGNELQAPPVAQPEASPEPSAVPEPTAVATAEPQQTGSPNAGEPTAAPTVQLTDPAPTAKPAATAKPPGGSGAADAELTAAEPDSVTVMVNKQYKLPDGYKPADLVYPDVPFLFSEKIEKRMMRKTAAAALEQMFAGAKSDGVYLAGVSAYRSEKTQTTLFNNYVKRDGEEKARTYSAVPGHSEHQTGLAIDVSGSDGKCAAESCFGGTKEANWLADHAAEYGFIIRYPEGKQAITGYKYEPWHIRYVGKDIAEDIAARGITLEEYYDAIPVSN
ncbi:MULTISPECIES: D-alanyl-D-alanine carboxypeptidase family protein [unclassified Paenibacillus]|uniref:M15 family metallopeptidase n=1 Tax=unclassified Paenibacillus TaxID=185978 RepID=UPI002405A5F0|nr:MULTISPECIES: D-alanyl-D-alanine carboxypeptidase family protein [unclassified Paenibacillus]MDF9840045.1 D-alanyl-D-alanine carboxypeptidase [Paenibacillus sp. PastF-2]MDF9846627.1 D-alanyl-D-alanine carboxypeptidase [Paenibacillus sp. PastM-2]MDF9853025.1 D-alanyl-D-alanine carboxypeptidase [Paenibacillus sp. PastF-1]MDH6478471.1 D-alanyl-D-alanine carboxypeptidase [Paenibacillus sp. PastH-2]MDH6506031.1 D-alanyl-D-alanine carboxypeptidase [Paenibacillus sp. PastM-3]